MPQFSLMKHQKKGVNFLEKVDGIGALLFDPGTGKTGTALTWIDRSRKLPAEVRVLVIAPLTAADTWVLQAPPFMDSVVKARLLQGSTSAIMAKMSKSGTWTGVTDAAVKADHTGNGRHPRRVTILSMSSGAISSYCKQRTDTVKMLRAVRKYAPHVIIVDESHLIKSANSNVSKAVYQMGQLVDHRIILTGTVCPLSDLDVYGQWRFLAPWTFSDQYHEPFTQRPLTMTKDEKMSIAPWPIGKFEKRYAEMGGFKGKQAVGTNDVTITELKDRVAERSMVVKKKDALDLPPTTDIDVHFDLNPKEARAYKEMAEELALQLESGELLEAPNALAKMMKLRQIHAGFVKDTETGEIHVVGDSLRKAMLEIATVTLVGEKRLVMSGYFRAECEALADALRKAEPNTTVEIITGATKAKDRLAIRQRFGDVSGNPTRTILVAQARTMSLSVNELITAQNLIAGSPSERRDDYVQLRDRLDRKGQKLPVTFWNVFSTGLIADIMVARHKDRGNMEAALHDHIRQYSKTRQAPRKRKAAA